MSAFWLLFSFSTAVGLSGTVIVLCALRAAAIGDEIMERAFSQERPQLPP